MLVTDNFFLGGGHIVLVSNSTGINPTAIRGLTITGNQWNGPYSALSIALDQSESNFTVLEDVSVSGNLYFPSYRAITTRMRVQIPVNGIAPNQRYCVNLGNSLLFPQFPIQWYQATFQSNQSTPHANSMVVLKDLPEDLPKGDLRGVCVAFVLIEGPAMVGTVFLEVDQSSQSQPGVYS